MIIYFDDYMPHSLKQMSKIRNYNILKLYMNAPVMALNLTNSISSNTPVSILEALSLYSPLITMLSILIFSIFSSALYKGLFYIASVLCVTAARMGFLFTFVKEYGTEANEKCKNGRLMPYTGRTYSTFIMMYTVCYFVVPMIILTKTNDENMVNPYVVAFFAAYICFDIIMKLYLMECITFGMGLIGDFLLGGVAGAGLALLLFYGDQISLMFINELNSNKEVCSVPSKQKFKCVLYKDGMIVGSSVPA